MINAIYITALAGFLLSVYTLYVEHRLKKNADYHAVCDISNRMSCTRTFHSNYGKMFGISNGWWGLIYYIAIAILVYLSRFDLTLYLAIVGVLMSARLAYILYFKLKNFCLVCNGIYLVNILLLVFAYLNY